MKNKSFLLFVLAIFCFHLASSEIILEELNKGLQAGETFVGRIEVNLKEDIRKQDVKIFEERREVFFERDIFRYGNKSYLYVIFPKEGNFNISIQDFLYYSGTGLKVGRINHLVRIKNRTNRILTIKPGIISGSNLSLFLTNAGSENITAELQGNKSNIDENTSKRVWIKPEGKFFYLSINSYRSFSIPVIYFNLSRENKEEQINITNLSEAVANRSEIDNISSEIKNFTFIVHPREINETLFVNNSFTFYIQLENKISSEINISINSSLRGLNFSKKESLEGFSKKNITFSFFSQRLGHFSDNITFSSDDFKKEVHLRFFVLNFRNGSIVEEKTGELTCSEMGGVLCEENYECIGGDPIILGGFCCVGGQCKNWEEETPRRNYLLGFISIIVALAIGYFIFMKFKKVRATPKI